MMQTIVSLLVKACWLTLVAASPVVDWNHSNLLGDAEVPLNYLEARQAGPAPLSLAEEQAFTPILHHASASYCQPNSIANWNCGTDCNEASPNFRTYRNGGGPDEGRSSPQWFVGYDPRNINPMGANNGTGTIVVSHEGTTRFTLPANGDSGLRTLDASLIPGAPRGARVHSGYFGNFVTDATAVYNAVTGALAMYPNARTVIVTGHSQGAALAVYTAVSLSLRPTIRSRNITVSVVAAAMPRTGNAEWAAFVSRMVPYVRRVNNVIDPIPVTPPISSSYVGLKGELHIQTPNGTWYNCSSSFDNPSSFCSVGATQPVFGYLNPGAAFVGATYLLNISPGSYFGLYHNGPYNGIAMGNRCTPPATNLSVESTSPLV